MSSSRVNTEPEPPPPGSSEPLALAEAPAAHTLASTDKPAVSAQGSTAPPAAPAAPAPLDQRASVVRLLLAIAAIVVLSIEAREGKTVLIIAVILLMIVLHELGHFVMAKLGGIKVTEFFVGFGTRLWSFRRGETEYGVKILPLGGYVKIIGMNNLEQVDPADEARTYRQQPFWRRISVAVAGSAMHFLIASLLLFLVFFAVGDQGVFGSVPGRGVKVTELDALASGPSPAEQAGFRIGDRIESVNGVVFKTIDDLTNYIKARPDQTLHVEVTRGAQNLVLDPHTVDLSKVQAETSAGEQTATANTKNGKAVPTGFIGFAIEGPTVRYGFFESFSKAGGAFVNIGAETLNVLGGLVSFHGVSAYYHTLISQKAADSTTAVRFESPIGIVRLAHTESKNGLEATLFLLILINIFVGIFNLIPMLPLDGGHVAIATYEAIRSRRGRRYQADVAKMMPFVYATLAVIGFIGVSALFLDLRDLVSIVKF